MPEHLAELAAVVVLALTLALGAATARADDTDAVLTRLGEAASCKDKSSPWRAWCPATGWAKGKAGALKPGVMAGITVALPADADVKQALTDNVTFVVLAVKKDGKKLHITLRDIKPENQSESEMVAKALMGVAFAASLDTNHDAVKGKAGWT